MSDSANSNDMNQTMQYLSLTPYEDVDLKGYEQAFEFIFNTKEVCNIAITGDYGIGKSSLIRSYDKKKEDKEFLYISLMHIELATHNSINEDKKDIKEDSVTNASDSSEYDNTIEDSVIQRKLINQLVQSVPTNKIPYTSFSVKRNDSHIITFLLAILTVIFISASIYTIHYNKIQAVIKIWITTARNPIAFMILGLLKSIRFELGLLLFMMIFAVYSMYRILLFITYRKSIFNDMTIDIKELKVHVVKGDGSGSYFDNHLDDILYMFENIDADAIVFEDLERFHNYRIFEQLREINDLVNIRIKNRRKTTPWCKKSIKPVRFFYLVNDNMFSDSSMVKFFDFIIPVIPALHVRDSYTEIKTKFDSIGAVVNDELLHIVSERIYDYSILKKLYNDFLIMKKSLPDMWNEIEDNKLLAVIIYKSIMPFDYSLFRKGQGQLYSILNLDKWIDEWVQDHEGHLSEQGKRKSKENYKSLSIGELIEMGIIPDEKIDGLYETSVDNSETQIIAYLLRNSYLDHDIFKYISQYKK